MTKKEQIYEGKAKTLFSYDDDKIIQYFKDDATAFNKKKHEIIDKKGIVITNNHVIQGAEDIFIRTNENKEYKAKILGTDPLSDVAVLQIITDDKFETVFPGVFDKT